MSALMFIVALADALFYLSSQGYDVLAVTAHAALESGWGTSQLFTSYNNPWGIKGDDVEITTQECINGEVHTVKDSFRAFNSIDDAAIDYDILIKTRYPWAWQYRDQPLLYFLGLQVDGYATDPEYFVKLVNVYRQLKGGEL